MDELFETLTLRQTSKAPAIPIVLVDKKFWTSAVNLSVFVEHGTISPADVDLVQYAETAEEVWDLLVKGGVMERRPNE